jgi:hypothetical protein
VAVSDEFERMLASYRAAERISLDRSLDLQWRLGIPMVDDSNLLYGTFYAVYDPGTGTGPTVVRGQRVPSMDEITPELIVRHKMFKEMWYIGEKVETPAMKRALEKHKHKVVRIEKMDGDDFIRIEDRSAPKIRPPKGCCPSCEGSGMGGPASDFSTMGRCSDCYATGHLHNEGEPCVA